MRTSESTVTDQELLETALETLRVEAAGVTEVASRLGGDFVRLARRVLECQGRVIVTGLGKSGLVARKIASTLASTGTPASFLHPTEGAHGDVGVLVPGDALLVVSKSGANAELTALVPAVRRLGIPILAICGTPGSPLVEAADVTVDAAVPEEACPHDIAPTASSTAALALGDALAMTVMRARGLDADDFARLHPAGALGRRLLWLVRDVMLSEKDVPTLGPDDALSQAMTLIAHQRGTVVVTDDAGHLLGVMTAGDLTRFASDHSGFLSRRVEEAMNRQPRSIEKHARAADALEVMEAGGIMALPVIDDGQVVGIVHLHDLLREGVRA
ncbi:MAG: KpsF/GutQ family sugar-phosphate isomerase [Gemmatimonadota bacterium]|nr:KpsF/GutQ family sugar-phosphate isomerase [Gemmatimonadota bacterium]